MDMKWWDVHIKQVRETFKGELFTTSQACRKHGIEPLLTYGVGFDPCGNSGAGCIALAHLFGASKVILLGYDCKHVGSVKHWHGDHPKPLGNAGSVLKWPEQFAAVAKKYTAAAVINCTPDSALDCFPKGNLEMELPGHPPIIIEGMHGLGDNLHQRGIIRELMKKNEIWLETPWPCLYHDLPIHFVGKGSRLRTQAKNAKREAGKFESRTPSTSNRMRVAYAPDMVRKHGSVYAAMSAHCNVAQADFSLPIPNEWDARAEALIAEWRPTKPILIYRPLIERSEWSGCHNRNPDHNAYHSLIQSIRERFFIVSVADLVQGQEWMVGKPINADISFHAGELDIEVLAALIKRSAMVYTSPGFAVILAQSVGTPSVVVFGGYENAQSFKGGAKLAPYLGIDPIHPCQCFSHRHKCQKQIDMPTATNQLMDFINANIKKP